MSVILELLLRILHKIFSAVRSCREKTYDHVVWTEHLAEISGEFPSVRQWPCCICIWEFSWLPVECCRAAVGNAEY